MGQEILYCFKCQTRLLGSDFDKGRAFRVNAQAACPVCVRELLAHLPDPDAELERLKQSHLPKPSGSSTKIPAVRPDSARLAVTRPAGTEPPPPPTSRTPLLIAAGVVALAVVALLAMVFSGSKEKPAPIATPQPLPDPTPRPTPRPNPTDTVARDLEELD